MTSYKLLTGLPSSDSTNQYIITPRRACAARSEVISLGLDIVSAKKIFGTQKILTFRSPFQHRKASLRI